MGVSEHAVQRVPKFMEHRPHIIRGEKSRLAGSGRGEIGDVTDNRARAQQFGLVHQVVHPGATLLVVALEVVAVKQRHGTAVGVKNFEHAHARGVDRKIFALLEGQSIELVGRVENTVLEHIVELEIGLDLLLVEIIFGFAYLLGVEVPVPRLDFKSALLFVNHGLDVLCFTGRLGCCRRHQRVHELQRRVRGFGHLVLQVPGSEVGKPEQLGLPGAQLCDAGDDVARVIGIAAFGAAPGVREERLTGGAIRQSDQIGLLGSVLQGQHEALHLAILRRLGRSTDLRIAKTRQRRFVRSHVCGGFRGSQQLGREVVGKGR